MNRRELLQRTAIVIGGSLLGADSLLANNVDWDNLTFKGNKAIGIFSKSDVNLLNLIADTIIPDTDTPGAKAAKTGQFIATIVSDCYEPKDQQNFVQGLANLQIASEKKSGKSFQKSNATQRHDLLVALDAEQKAYAKVKKKEDPHHYFRVVKDLSMWGYFTSEIGATQALRFVEYPGRYETIDYHKGDRGWGGY